MKYTRHTLKKIEGQIQEAGFVIRYEKGHFQAGFCLLEEKRIVLINKFFDLEAKINTLAEILNRITEQGLAQITKDTQQNFVFGKQIEK